jgi:hypothetical protein
LCMMANQRPWAPALGPCFAIMHSGQGLTLYYNLPFNLLGVLL